MEGALCQPAPGARKASQTCDPCHSAGKGARHGADMSMISAPRKGPVVNERAKSPEQVRRAQRLAAALRENLKRRKAQSKGRGARSEPAGLPHDSAGIDADNQPPERRR